jgi:hypothetical protein
MNGSGKREINPRKAAQELTANSPLSQKQAAAYVYFNTIDDPEKQATDIFHIPAGELENELTEAEEIAEGAKKIKKMDIEGTPLKAQIDILIGCGLLTEKQAKAFRACKEAGDKTASKTLDRSIEAIREDSQKAETKIEQAREMYGWLIDYSGVEVY